jgi:spore maturation protein SpmA
MTRPDREKQLQTARQARMVAFVIAGTMLLWMGAQWIGGQMGLEARFVFLFDFAALAAFFWALVVTYQIWRKRQG